MEQGRAGWNFGNFITMNYGFSLKILQFNKSAGWNKGAQVGKSIEFNKICCTIIKETKVRPSQTQGNQMNDIPDRIEVIQTPIYQSSMLSKKSIESTQMIQSSQLSEDSTQLFESSQLSNQSKLVRKTRSKNKRELSYLDNSCILLDCKRTRHKN